MDKCPKLNQPTVKFEVNLCSGIFHNLGKKQTESNNHITTLPEVINMSVCGGLSTVSRVGRDF